MAKNKQQIEVDTSQEVKAIARYIRMSPFKVRRVLNQIRGRSYREALIILEFMPYRACEPIVKVLRSAVANAEHNQGLDPSDLVVSQIRKRTCHITVAVAPMA